MFQQNCLYSTQGDLLCKNEEKSKPILNGFPNSSKYVVETFKDTSTFNNSVTVPKISGKKLLRDQNDPASVGFVNANLISAPGQKPYSCSIDNCTTVCPLTPDNKGIFACDLQCDNCTLDGKKKASYKSKTNDKPVRIKKDGTPGYNINAVPCVNINTNERDYTTLSTKNTTCRETTFAEYAASVKNSVATAAEAAAAVSTEHFQDFSPAFQEDQPPFFDQRVFKSFWSPK
jgi:hypothetical protein